MDALFKYMETFNKGILKIFFRIIVLATLTGVLSLLGSAFNNLSHIKLDGKTQNSTVNETQSYSTLNQDAINQAIIAANNSKPIVNSNTQTNIFPGNIPQVQSTNNYNQTQNTLSPTTLPSLNNNNSQIMNSFNQSAQNNYYNQQRNIADAYAATNPIHCTWSSDASGKLQSTCNR